MVNVIKGRKNNVQINFAKQQSKESKTTEKKIDKNVQF